MLELFFGWFVVHFQLVDLDDADPIRAEKSEAKSRSHLTDSHARRTTLPVRHDESFLLIGDRDRESSALYL